MVLLQRIRFGGVWNGATAGDKIKNNTTLIHVGGKFRSVQFDVASINNKEAYASDADSGGNSKFAPLGSMLIGTADRGGTATAVAIPVTFSSEAPTGILLLL
jgi:hypothetical protein